MGGDNWKHERDDVKVTCDRCCRADDPDDPKDFDFQGAPMKCISDVYQDLGMGWFDKVWWCRLCGGYKLQDPTGFSEQKYPLEEEKS